MRRVIGWDPGAMYMGYGCVDGDGLTPPTYVVSGEVSTPKQGGEKWQDYRLRVTNVWTFRSLALFTELEPDEIATETIPPKGFEGGGTQEQLAAAAITAVHSVAFLLEIPVTQIAANTVKARIGGTGTKSKVAVRNGVTQILPELKPRWREWVKRQNEPDAIGVALTHLGYHVIE